MNLKNRQKTVLIVCYYWPPAGGPGVQRWLKFVKYLRDYNIEPIVYVPENPTYPILDKSLQEEIPQGVQVLKQKIKEPFSLAKIFSKKQTQTLSSGIIADTDDQSLLQKAMLFIRGNFFIPDSRIGWVKPSTTFLTDYIKKRAIDAIITSGPPHSLHLIGLNISNKLKLPWLADFRDPWTTIGYHSKLKLTLKSEKKHLALESEVLNTADHIVVTAPKTKSDFEAITPVPIDVITNGFDDEKMSDVPLDKKFVLSHIGSLTTLRNPEILWEVLAQLKMEQPGFAKNLRLKLAGKVSEAVIHTLKKHGLSEQVDHVGYVDHKEALRLQRSAQVLLLIEVNSANTQAIIPGKIFEYLAARRPIIAIGPDQADFFDIIKETKSGKTFRYVDKNELYTHISILYQKYLSHQLRNTTGDISTYSRKNLTGKLAEVIDRITH